jgi:DNA replication and repair protein RecF
MAKVIIKRLTIQHLRNIESADLDFSPKVNIVSGGNGAGKTTLLEAIYLLARAKSFRIGSQTTPIQKGKERLTIYAEAQDAQNIEHRIGLEKGGSERRIRIVGRSVTRVSELARLVPIALVTPMSHKILEDGPRNRRRLINWGLFHVEHDFKSLMTDFSKSLLQRNNALRKGSRDLSVWDETFSDCAERVSVRQERYVEGLRSHLFDLCSEIHFLRKIDISFSKGWSKEETLRDAILKRRVQDRENGYTHAGPQRCDLILKIDGSPIRQILSRGQQKILIALILVAQAKLLEKARGEKPVFLFDDLQSELDENSVGMVSRLLDDQRLQTVITSVSGESVSSMPWSIAPRLFHVEHGSFARRDPILLKPI